MDLNGVKARAASKLLAGFAHNHNEVSRMSRAVQAQQLGLPASEYATPYPGDQTTTNTTVNHHGISAGGFVAALAAAGLIAGGAGVAGVKLAQPAQQAAAPVTPAAPASPAPVIQPAPAYDGRLVQEQRQADGSWKFLWSLPARRLPDGAVETNDGRKWKAGKDGTTWEEAH